MTHDSNTTDNADSAPDRKRDSDLPTIKPNETLYNWLFWGSYAVYGLLSLFAILVGWHVILLKLGPLSFNLGIPMIIALGAHIFFSLKRVETSDIAGKYSYGVPLHAAKPGLNFVPVGLMQLIVYPADLQEILEPGSREEIFWGDEEIELPDGMVRPIWLPTKAPDGAEEEGAGPLHAQMVVGVAYHVFYRIVDIFTFHAHVGGTEEAEKQLRLISVRALGEKIVEYTAGEAVEKQRQINEEFDNRIHEDTRSWGIKIPNAGLEQINLSLTRLARQ